MDDWTFDATRYEKWTGEDEAAWDAESLFDSLSEDLMRTGDIDLAMQRAFRWGFGGRDGQDVQGLRDLVDRLRRQRQQMLDRHDFGSAFDDVARQLDDIVERERSTLHERKDAAGAADQDELANGDSSERSSFGDFIDRRLNTIDNLPDALQDKIRTLQDYEFVNRQAGEDFRELVESLQKTIADAMFNNLMGGQAGGEGGSGPDMTDFLNDLNDAFDAAARGEQPDLDRLNNRWANQLGGRVDSIDQLRARLQERRAAAQALMGMLSPQQRREMLDLMSQMMRDAGLQDAMQRLQSHLGPAPASNLGQTPGHLQHDISFEMAMQVMEQAGRMSDLEAQLTSVMDVDELRGLDPELLERVLSEEDKEWVDRWANAHRHLEDAGLVKDGRRGLELTPQAIRKIGQHALEDIFSSLSNLGIGEHDLHDRGRMGEWAESTSPWQFGDPFVLDLPRTMMNGVMRNGPGTPVRLDPDSFEVLDREARTSTATVLLIDMSRSMLNNGCWDAAKRTALALDTLIRSKYPRDVLELVGFAATAHPLTMQDLPTLEWNEYTYGTNLQHALELARDRLRAERGKNRQIIVVTDGEPTAHLEHGEVFFHYPPLPETFEATLREVLRCTKEGITINTFLLEHTPYMRAFVEDLMRLNKGKVINASPSRLGSYVLKDFLSQRTRDRLDA